MINSMALGQPYKLDMTKARKAKITYPYNVRPCAHRAFPTRYQLPPLAIITTAYPASIVIADKPRVMPVKRQYAAFLHLLTIVMLVLSVGVQ